VSVQNGSKGKKAEMRLKEEEIKMSRIQTEILGETTTKSYG